MDRTDGGLTATLLGVRGSMPAPDPACGRYGGETLCVRLDAGAATLLLDAGTGLRYAGTLPQRVHLLLSHAHADHLLGLPLWPALWEPGREVVVWGSPRGGLSTAEQVERLLSPPLWPVGPGDFSARLTFRDLPQGPLELEGVTVRTAPCRHPGGATAFRLERQGRSLVYLTDCELDGPTLEAMSDFAAGCSLLLCDGQYTDGEYPARRGWGHSSQSMALALAGRCAARRTVLIHHDPGRTDAELDAMETGCRLRLPDCRYGRQGERFQL